MIKEYCNKRDFKSSLKLPSATHTYIRYIVAVAAQLWRCISGQAY